MQTVTLVLLALSVVGYASADCSVFDGFNIIGGDLSGTSQEVTDASECCSLCDSNPDCKSWTFNKSTKKCYPKNDCFAQLTLLSIGTSGRASTCFGPVVTTPDPNVGQDTAGAIEKSMAQQALADAAFDAFDYEALSKFYDDDASLSTGEEGGDYTPLNAIKLFFRAYFIQLPASFPDYMPIMRTNLFTRAEYSYDLAHYVVTFDGVYALTPTNGSTFSQTWIYANGSDPLIAKEVFSVFGANEFEPSTEVAATLAAFDTAVAANSGKDVAAIYAADASFKSPLNITVNTQSAIEQYWTNRLLIAGLQFPMGFTAERTVRFAGESVFSDLCFKDTQNPGVGDICYTSAQVFKVVDGKTVVASEVLQDAI